MAGQKTKETDASIQAYLDAIMDESRRQDCNQLIEIMQRVTGKEAKLWGSSIIGFGSYHYKYESGTEGDSCLVGFASRKGDISLYLSLGIENRESILADFGKYKSGKSCLYIKHVSDIKIPILETLVAETAAERRRRYPE